MQTAIVFHSENGPGIGGSDFKMGRIIDSLDRERWHPLVLANAQYPMDAVFHRLPFPERIGGGVATNSQQGSSAVADSSTQPQSPSIKQRVKSLIARSLPVSWKRKLGYRKVALRVETLVRQHQVQVFQAMDAGPQPTIVGAKHAGCATISHYAAPPGDGQDPLTVQYSRYSASQSDVLLAASHYNARLWADYMQISPDRFTVIHNGIDLQSNPVDARRSVRSELNIPQESMVIGMTGRMNAEKGPTYFADAAIELCQQHADLVVLFTGQGSELPAIQDKVKSAGLESRFRFLGFRKDAVRVTAAYDIAVVPSVFPEPFGMVVIEAMAAGIPVVASRVGGIPEIIEQDVSGILVPPQDAPALAKTIGALVQSPERRREMGASGRKRVEAYFTHDRMIRDYTQMYEQLLRTKSLQHPAVE